MGQHHQFGDQAGRARRFRAAGWRRGPPGARGKPGGGAGRAARGGRRPAAPGSPRPRSGRAMHIASRARSRRSREVSSAARRTAAGPAARALWRRAAPPEPPLAGRAATTRPITIAGSRSSRSATRRTRSSRLALSPIPARIGATSASARSRSVGEETSVRSSTSPTWKAVSSTAPSTRAAEALGAALGRHHLRRVLALRHRRHAQPHLAAAPRPAEPAASPPGPAESASSASTTSSTIPESAATCSVGDRRAHHPDRLLDPGLVQGEHVGVALDHHRPAGLGDRRLGRSMPVEHPALVEEVGLRRVDVLGALVGAHRPPAEAERAAAAVADREHDPRAEAVVLASAPPSLDQPDPAQLLDLEARPLAAQQHLVPGARRVADRRSARSTSSPSPRSARYSRALPASFDSQR